MVLAIRCQPIAPVSADDLQGWLELELHALRAALPRGTVRLSRLTQGGPNADLEIGWLVELEIGEGEPPLGQDRLADALRDMRLLGLEPRLLVPAHPDASEAGNGNTPARGGKDSGLGGRRAGMTAHDHGGAALALAEPPDSRRIDHDALQRAARELLRALGADVDIGALEETPRRVADAYAELLTPRPFRATTFPNDDGYDEFVVARAIPFHSLCMHHLLPFHGVAHIGYLPGARLIGLSKLGRVVEFFSRDLQIQERLTTQIADWLQSELDPKGVGVVLEAEHLCMSLRGVQKLGAKTVTSALRGRVRDDPRTRQEFLALTTRTSHDQ